MPPTPPKKKTISSFASALQAAAGETSSPVVDETVPSKEQKFDFASALQEAASKKKVGTDASFTGATGTSSPLPSNSEAPSPSTANGTDGFLAPLKDQQYNLSTLGGMVKPPAANIVESIVKDRDRTGNLAAGVYNTLVNSVSRFAGGLAAAGYAVGKAMRVGSNEGLATDAEVRQGVTNFIDQARSPLSTKEQEEARSEFDITNGIDVKDVKAVAFQAPSQIADMIAGAYTGGASFFMQSVNDSAKELEENPNADKLSTPHKLGYLFTQAAVQAVLEKFALDKIMKGTGVSKKISQKISSEIIDEFASKGVKATAKQVEEAAFRKASQLTTKIKSVGVKAATGFGAEATTEAVQQGASDAIKLLSNRVSGDEVFDEKDISQNFIKNMANAGVQGGAFGGLFGGVHAATTNTNKAIRREVAKANSKEDFDVIKNDINKEVELGNITPQEAKDANIKADLYAEIASKVPGELSADQKYALIGGIEQRETLKHEIDKANADILAIDPAFHGEKMTQLQLLNAKLEQTNDYLHELVTGEKVQYIEKDGEYFKKDSRGEAKITKPYYDLATTVDEENERKGTPVVPAVIMPDEINRVAVTLPQSNIQPNVIPLTNATNESGTATTRTGTEAQNTIEESSPLQSNEGATAQEEATPLNRDPHTGILHRAAPLKINEEVLNKFEELDRMRESITEEGANRKERKTTADQFIADNPHIGAVDKHFSFITKQLEEAGELKKSSAECP